MITFNFYSKKTFSYSAAGILLAWGVFTAVMPVGKASAQTVEANPVVARVNNIPIHRDALDRELELLTKKYKISSTKFTSKEAEERQYRNILDKLVTVELFRQAVHSEALPVEDKKLEERIREAKARFSSEEEFLKKLNQSGKTPESYKAELRETILLEEYLKRNQLKEISIPQQEMERYYKQNAASFTNPEQIKVRHILINLDPDPKPETVESALKKARAIRDQIVAGKSFSDVAKEQSQCSSASEGGNLGYIQRGYMPSAFDTVAFTLKSGEISEPIRTQFGYHIVETLEHKPESIKPFDEVKDFIRKRLGSIQEQQRMAAHIEGLKKKAKIELFLDQITDAKRQ